MTTVDLGCRQREFQDVVEDLALTVGDACQSSLNLPTPQNYELRFCLTIVALCIDDDSNGGVVETFASVGFDAAPPRCLQ